MTKKDMLYNFYQQIANDENWTNKNYKIILTKDGLRIKTKDGEIELKRID